MLQVKICKGKICTGYVSKKPGLSIQPCSLRGLGRQQQISGGDAVSEVLPPGKLTCALESRAFIGAQSLRHGGLARPVLTTQSPAVSPTQGSTDTTWLRDLNEQKQVFLLDHTASTNYVVGVQAPHQEVSRAQRSSLRSWSRPVFPLDMRGVCAQTHIELTFHCAATELTLSQTVEGFQSSVFLMFITKVHFVIPMHKVLAFLCISLKSPCWDEIFYFLLL